MDCCLPGPSVHGILQQDYWTGLPFPPPGDVSNLGIEFLSLPSPALAGELFTTSVTWEVHINIYIYIDQGSNLCLLNWQADSLSLGHQGSPLL